MKYLLLIIKTGQKGNLQICGTEQTTSSFGKIQMCMYSELETQPLTSKVLCWNLLLPVNFPSNGPERQIAKSPALSEGDEMVEKPQGKEILNGIDQDS